MQPEPFALALFRRHLEGESIEQLAEWLSIPEERIRQRVRAAAQHTERRKALREFSELDTRLEMVARGRPS